MARNKYPEVTVSRILDVSEQLFLEKGYEHTTIQDIINALGNLSKGAIYHHFKSKEEIVIAVVDRLYVSTEEGCAKIQEDKTLNGLEKLRKLFYLSIGNPNHGVVFETMPNFFKNPKFLAIQHEQTMNELAHKIIEPIISEGIADGSIETQYPKELAEVISLLSNIWLNPIIFKYTPEELSSKCFFFKLITEKLGVPMFDDEMVEAITQIGEMRKK
ncbi:MAG: TetR/AcrR family transcriptional regulator [Eubacteriaceae bacterium]